MSLPKLTGLTPEDVEEFDALLDCIPRGYTRALDAFMNRMIAAQLERDRQNAAELDALTRQLEQGARPMTRSERVSAYVDSLAACDEPPSPLDRIH